MTGEVVGYLDESYIFITAASYSSVYIYHNKTKKSS